MCVPHLVSAYSVNYCDALLPLPTHYCICAFVGCLFFLLFLSFSLHLFEMPNWVHYCAYRLRFMCNLHNSISWRSTTIKDIIINWIIASISPAHTYTLNIFGKRRNLSIHFECRGKKTLTIQLHNYHFEKRAFSHETTINLAHHFRVTSCFVCSCTIHIVQYFNSTFFLRFRWGSKQRIIQISNKAQNDTSRENTQIIRTKSTFSYPKRQSWEKCQAKMVNKCRIEL